MLSIFIKLKKILEL